MIIGKRFAWQHMPRTAGTFTQRCLEAIPDLEIEFSDPMESERSHTAFFERKRDCILDDKLLVMNIRRLPTWIASQARVVAQRQGKKLYSTDPATRALSVDQLCRMSLGDEMLKYFLRDTHIDRWIRLETIEDDIKRLAWEIGNVPQLIIPRHVPQTIAHYTQSQLRSLYENNPLWAEVEIQAYGSLPEMIAYESEEQRANREHPERALGVASAPNAPVMSGGKFPKDKPLPPAKATPESPRAPKRNGQHIVKRTGANVHHFGPFSSREKAVAFMTANGSSNPNCSYETHEMMDPDNDADDVSPETPVSAAAA